MDQSVASTPPTPVPPTPPAMPVPPGFTLGTAWASLSNLPNCENVTELSAAPDNTLWYAAQPYYAQGGYGLFQYVPDTGAWKQVWVGVAMGVSALSATEAWVLGADEMTPPNVGHWVGHFVDGQMTKVAAVPDDSGLQQLSAAPDGTVWVHAFSGKLYAYADNAWTLVDHGGYTIEQVAVGSATNIWARGTGSGGAVVLYHTPGGGWQEDTSLAGEVADWIGANADGSAWLRTSVFYYAKPTASTPWTMISDLPGITDPVQVLWDATASRYFVYGVNIDYSNLQCTPQRLAYGITDQPATPWPAWSAAEQAAEAAIVNQLGIVGVKSIRDAYTDATAPFQEWISLIKAMTAPAGIDPAAFAVVQQQLLKELNFVIEVNKLFVQITDLNVQIGVVNATVLPTVAPMVELSKPSGPDGDRTARLVLEGMFEAALWGIGAALSGGLAIAAALVASGVGSAISALEGGGSTKDDPNQAVAVQYSQLADTMTNFFTSANVANAEMQAKILQDWGMLSAVGGALSTTVWRWPTMANADIAQHAHRGFELYFYKSLMPAKWKIVTTPWGDPDQYPFNKAPGYDLYTEPIKPPPGLSSAEQVWFFNEVDAGINLNGPMGPYPAQALIEYVLWTLEVSPADFFKGNGWPMTVKKATVGRGEEEQEHTLS